MPCKGFKLGHFKSSVSFCSNTSSEKGWDYHKNLSKTKSKQTNADFKSRVKMCLWACPRGHSWPWEWCSDDLTELQTQARKCFARVFRIGSWHPRDIPGNWLPNETQGHESPLHHNTRFWFNEPFKSNVGRGHHGVTEGRARHPVLHHPEKSWYFPLLHIPPHCH